MKELFDRLKALDPETWEVIENAFGCLEDGGHGCGCGMYPTATHRLNSFGMALLQGIIQDAIEAMDDWAWDLDYCPWDPRGHRHGALVWFGVDERKIAKRCPTAAEALLTAYVAALEETT